MAGRLKLRVFLLSLGLAAVSLGLSLIASTGVARAADGSDFAAGRIISDSLFFNGDGMSIGSIQKFLNSKVPVCDTDGSEPSEYGGGTRAEWGTAQGYPPPYICLKSFTAKIPAMAADSYCTRIQSSGDNKKKTAEIIFQVAQACHVNPKVLIVTLQKEQGLVTDEWPLPTQYRKAMGYGCPDSNLPSSVDGNDNGCYDSFEGFFKQIYFAARQFQLYAQNPDQYNFRAGLTTQIRWSPKSDCGAGTVTIRTQATAGLYNYTPYQPNQAALNNLYGSGNGCSSYGNRNFWRDYNDWFGSSVFQGKDFALVGDWNCNGWAGVAVKRGNIYLLDNNRDGVVDLSFTYGEATDQPIVGHWQGNAVGDSGKPCDTISLKRGKRYFINNGLSTGSDYSFTYGQENNRPVVGDWDGNGTDSVSLKIGRRYAINNNPTAPQTSSWLTYGQAQDRPVVGDWDGDGTDTISLKVGNRYAINNIEAPAAPQTSLWFQYGWSSDQPLPGRWPDEDPNTSQSDQNTTISLHRGDTFFLNYKLAPPSDSSFVFAN